MASNHHEKIDSGHAEDLENVHTQLESEEVANLSPEHKQYLLERHGTLELDPVPDMSDADPYNWATSKVSLIQLGSCRRARLTQARNASTWHSWLSMP